jgi:hypothetical protein
VRPADPGVGIERGGVADAAEPAPAGRLVGVERVGHRLVGEVGEPHDPGDLGPGRPAALGQGRHRGRLAHGAEVLRAVVTVGPAALQEDGRLHPVAGAGVGVEVVHEVGEHPVDLPEVVVGIDDGQVGSMASSTWVESQASSQW